MKSEKKIGTNLMIEFKIFSLNQGRKWEIFSFENYIGLPVDYPQRLCYIKKYFIVQ